MTKFKILAAFFSICLIFNFFSSLSGQSLAPIYQKGSATLVADLTIGGDTEDENYLLSGPSRVCLDSKGNIFILDSKESHIKKFNATGKYIKTFSGPGNGPGEIQTCFQMAIDPTDKLVTYDLGNRRFSFFDSDGNFLNSIRFNEIVRDFKIGSEGKFYIETHTWDFSGKKGTLIKINQASRDLTEMVVVDSARIKNNTYITEPVRTNVPVPFAPRFAWGIAPSGNIVTAFAGDYTIKIFAPDLKLLRTIKHKGKQLKVTDEDKENHFAGMVSSGGGQQSRGAPDFIRKATEFPKFKPYFLGMLIDPEGNILIHTFESEKEKVVYDVFDAKGNFIKQGKFPFLGASTFKKGFIYQVKGGEDEFPVVVRYRLL